MQSQEKLPEFDTAFQLNSFYFYHIIDPDEATLRIEVLGPNLTYTFRHDRAKQLFSASEVANRLDRKTVGFLAVVAADRRVVLTWAQSGHGHSTKGNILEPGPALLSNPLWARRVMAVARQLGHSIRHPYDGRAAKDLGREMPGIHAGSHVEVKLAVHAVFTLLSAFGIEHDANDVRRHHLRQLRTARWEDGSRPTFEVYFSRKPCGRCAKLVSSLEKITGVSIHLRWTDRLYRKVYEKKNISKDYLRVSGGGDRPRDEAQGDIISISDEEALDDDWGDDDNDTAAVTDESANCIGQAEQKPQDAEKAIPDLAEPICGKQDAGNSNKTRGGQAQPPKRGKPHTSISKPLPATPATEAPWWMMGLPAPPPDAKAEDRASNEPRAVERARIADLPTPPVTGN
ncbi:hypothetical protein ESCO_004643 [Escovopsis weberi]|uniref:Uncharacterized protein n=1 Tax=Escovopsis weberi TaxID=150374 RepID=A0A0M8MQ22_ESCWE|nr:hypothetical protein ESCO_004643 [Escovopsis weberi]